MDEWSNPKFTFALVAKQVFVRNYWYENMIVNNFESYIVIEIRFNLFCAYLQQPNLKLDVDVHECSSNVPSLEKRAQIIYIYIT